MASLGKWLVGGCSAGKTSPYDTRLVVIVFGCGGVAVCPLWCTDARLVGYVGDRSCGVDYSLSSCGIVRGGSDSLVSSVVVARRRLFGLGVHLFGRYISYDSNAFGSATLYDVVPLHLFYATIHRPGGARLGVVAFDAGCGGDAVVLLAGVVGVGATEKSGGNP